jgi:hypothetical protein
VRRVVPLPSEGQLIVATDLQGNLQDFIAVEEVFEEALGEPGGAILVVTGDLVHGPEILESDWPDHLGTYYLGDSPGVLQRARDLQARHPGRVHYLLGNHEHAHIGGPVVSKFFPNEAARLEALLGERESTYFREWIRTWPFIAYAPSAGLAMMHAAPHAIIECAEDLERLPLEASPEDVDHLDDRSTLIALLWARSTSSERARGFLSALDPRLRVAVYGHDVAQQGFAIDREPLLCVSTSFGCHDGDKLYLSWDLSRHASGAREVALDGLCPLHPQASPIHRRRSA